MEQDLNWLNAAIAKGLMGLVTLRLPNTPPEEIIVKTAQIWVLALTKGLGNTWNEEDDLWRIENAFMRLYADCDRFPSPKMLIERLPKRKEQPLALLTREPTQEERNRHQAWIKKIKEMIHGHTMAK